MSFSDSPSLSINVDELLEKDEVVLAVDDNQAVVELYQDFLQKDSGLKTLTAGSAKEFRRVFEKVSVALVLLDIN
ncbi:MAG: response regulator, partial [Candidatus Electrothrix sp. ATG2]|nr:response regulator [Candidatus Electrothrix sp. ATG2]